MSQFTKLAEDIAEIQESVACGDRHYEKDERAEYVAEIERKITEAATLNPQWFVDILLTQITADRDRLAAELEQAQLILAKVKHVTAVVEKMNENQTEMEAALCCSFNEAMVHDVLAATEAELEQERQLVAWLEQHHPAYVTAGRAALTAARGAKP